MDWIMLDDPLKGNEQLIKERYKWLAKLDVAQVSPCLNLSEKNVMKFKIMLGAGYEGALYGNFDSVQPCIEQALLFLRDRNKEQSRFLILSFSTIIVVLSLLIVFFILPFFKRKNSRIRIGCSWLLCFYLVEIWKNKPKRFGI